ncbi:hypothetical protein POY24_27090, partial [Klebsiella pneumoniae]|uniref:hypothetical protein n=1 Tax=Klebsiella pneumoniae TaxID=573 RepID=UPI001BB01930
SSCWLSFGSPATALRLTELSGTISVHYVINCMTYVIHNQQKKPAKKAGEKYWYMSRMKSGIT